MILVAVHVYTTVVRRVFVINERHAGERAAGTLEEMTLRQVAHVVNTCVAIDADVISGQR